MAKRPTSGTRRPTGAAAFTAALSSRELPQILDGVLDRIDEDRKQEIRLEAKRSRAESEMLAADLKRLADRHGKDHPRVRKVQAAQASMERQVKLAEAMVRRMETYQPPARGGWTAAGRILTQELEPLVKVQVEFMAAVERQTALEPATTDEEGEFYATYSAAIVKQLVENESQLNLVVRKGRNILYRDPTSFSIEPNTIRQFQVKVEKAKQQQK